jgi:hypothetical protein
VQELNGFFGFAVSRCLKNMEKKERIAEFDEDETSWFKYENCTYFLENMRILHRDTLSTPSINAVFSAPLRKDLKQRKDF